MLEANTYFRFGKPVTVNEMQVQRDTDVIRMVPPGISRQSGLARILLVKKFN